MDIKFKRTSPAAIKYGVPAIKKYVSFETQSPNRANNAEKDKILNNKDITLTTFLRANTLAIDKIKGKNTSQFNKIGK